jgi:hypothetical protein
MEAGTAQKQKLNGSKKCMKVGIGWKQGLQSHGIGDRIEAARDRIKAGIAGN